MKTHESSVFIAPMPYTLNEGPEGYRLGIYNQPVLTAALRLAVLRKATGIVLAGERYACLGSPTNDKESQDTQTTTHQYNYIRDLLNRAEICQDKSPEVYRIAAAANNTPEQLTGILSFVKKSAGDNRPRVVVVGMASHRERVELHLRQLLNGSGSAIASDYHNTADILASKDSPAIVNEAETQRLLGLCKEFDKNNGPYEARALRMAKALDWIGLKLGGNVVSTALTRVVFGVSGAYLGPNMVGQDETGFFQARQGPPIVSNPAPQHPLL